MLNKSCIFFMIVSLYYVCSIKVLKKRKHLKKNYHIWFYYDKYKIIIIIIIKLIKILYIFILYYFYTKKTKINEMSL